MALTTLQTVGIAVLGVGGAALGINEIKKAIDRKRLREQGKLPPGAPTCAEGLTARRVDGEWQCLPVTAFEECLEGIYSNARVTLPQSVSGTLGENALKTAAQFFGFQLTSEAIEEVFPALIQAADTTDDEAYYAMREDLMPCGWLLDGAEAQRGWPLDSNLYQEGPWSDRMNASAMALFQLFTVALSQGLDKFLPVDVDPVNFIQDVEKDACARGDVLNLRSPGVPTSEAVVMGSLTVAGFDLQTQNVDEVMAQLEAENPLLIEYLDGDWMISNEIQDEMWRVMLEVAAYPKPVQNTVYNVQKGEVCAWDEKDAYTISMATLWYSAKRMAAIAELSNVILPVIVTETQGA